MSVPCQLFTFRQSGRSEGESRKSHRPARRGEVGLFFQGGTGVPVQHLRRPDLEVPPCQQIAEDQVLEVGTTKHRLSREVP